MPIDEAQGIGLEVEKFLILVNAAIHDRAKRLIELDSQVVQLQGFVHLCCLSQKEAKLLRRLSGRKLSFGLHTGIDFFF